MIEQDGEKAGGDHEQTEFGGFHEVFGPVSCKRFEHNDRYQYESGVTNGISWRCMNMTVEQLRNDKTAMPKRRP